MKFILIIFLFTLDPQGNPNKAIVLEEEYFSKRTCDVAGKAARDRLEIFDKRIKSISYCVQVAQ